MDFIGILCFKVFFMNFFFAFLFLFFFIKYTLRTAERERESEHYLWKRAIIIIYNNGHINFISGYERKLFDS